MRIRKSPLNVLAVCTIALVCACGQPTAQDGPQAAGAAREGKAATSPPTLTDRSPRSRLEGAWRIHRLGAEVLQPETIPRDRSLLLEMQFENDSFVGRLTCAYVNGKYDAAAARISPESVQSDGTKCPQAEVLAGAMLANILRDPAAAYQFAADRLTISGAGSDVELRLVAGTRGPTDPALDILGAWHIETLDGAPPLPGFARDEGPSVTLSLFQVSAYSGCNSGSTSVVWGARSLQAINLVLQTLMGCGELTAQEALIFGMFRAASFSLEKGVLTMRSADHVMTLTRK